MLIELAAEANQDHIVDQEVEIAEIAETAEIEVAAEEENLAEAQKSQVPEINVSFAKSLATGKESIRRSNTCSKGDGEGVRSGKCFKCNKKGHRARECPENKKLYHVEPL